jgi:hypothetical protein
MPNLDETWASAYFQAAVAVLVFGVGLPALILQMIVPEDLRRIVRRRDGWMSGLWVLVIFSTAMALTFVWLLHPSPGPVRRLLPWLGPDVDGPLAALAVTAALVGVALVLRLFRKHRRNQVLRRLEGICLDWVKSKGIADEEALADIRYLGEHATARAERMDVLKSLELLAKEIKSHKGYDGSRLEAITRAIECCLLADTDHDVLGDGVAALERIATHRRVHEGGVPDDEEPDDLASPDTATILRTIQRLMPAALLAEDCRPAERILKALDSVGRGSAGLHTEAERALLELGALALEQQRFDVAVAALSKLEAEVMLNEPIEAHGGRHYLGLVAHFWDRGGAARQAALDSLRNVGLAGPQIQALRDARTLHYRAARFATADALDRMIDALKPRRPARSIAGSVRLRQGRFSRPPGTAPPARARAAS